MDPSEPPLLKAMYSAAATGPQSKVHGECSQEEEPLSLDEDRF